jgi:hypothetical protein
MWFMKFVSGKPFGSFEKFTDTEWRRAYQHIEDINDLKVDLPIDYLVAGEPETAPAVDNIKKMFPGAQELPIATAPDGTKVNTQTGEVLDENGDPIIPDDL